MLGYQLIERAEKIQSCTLLEAYQCILMQLPQKVTVCYVNQAELKFRSCILVISYGGSKVLHKVTLKINISFACVLLLQQQQM